MRQLLRDPDDDIGLADTMTVYRHYVWDKMESTVLCEHMEEADIRSAGCGFLLFYLNCSVIKIWWIRTGNSEGNNAAIFRVKVTPKTTAIGLS